MPCSLLQQCQIRSPSRQISINATDTSTTARNHSTTITQVEEAIASIESCAPGDGLELSESFPITHM
jgi:hypothetical protein